MHSLHGAPCELSEPEWCRYIVQMSYHPMVKTHFSQHIHRINRLDHHCTWNVWIYLLTLGLISNSSIAQIHCLLHSRCASSPIWVLAFIIGIQTRCRLQGCCLWATGKHHIFCPYLAQCWRHGYGTGTNRRGIGRASRWYYDGASSCYAWPLNEEFGILVKESAGRIRL